MTMLARSLNTQTSPKRPEKSHNAKVGAVRTRDGPVYHVLRSDSRTRTSFRGKSMPPKSAEPNCAEIEARLQMVIARTAQTLSDADRAMIRKQIARALDLRAGLRAVALENHDEPEHGFDPAALQLQALGRDRRR
jgi:hypothetical protein